MHFSITVDSAERAREMHRFVLQKCWEKVVKLYRETPREALRSVSFLTINFTNLERYVQRSWVFSVPIKLERPSVDDAKLRLFNLDPIRAPGKAQSESSVWNG